MTRVSGWIAAGGAAVLLVAGCSSEQAAPEPEVQVSTDPAGNPVTVTVTPPPDTEQTTLDPTLPTGSDPSAATPTVLAAPGLPSPTPPPTGVETGEATSAPEIPEGAPNGITILLPQGWEALDLGAVPAPEGVVGAPAHRWCLTPGYDLPSVDGCAGLTVSLGQDWLPGAAGGRYAPGQDGGWYHGAEPLVCPFAEVEEEAEETEEEQNLVVDVGDGTPLTSVATVVGDHPARYETWRVRCALTEEVFTPQVWQVTDLGVLVVDYFGAPDTHLILESISPVEAP